ncbi:hypothetical protein TNIN_227571 [Trichonephila inaurata madagascariensis]|uniref:Uncharacterized protein n=1 Tax=Trichonephila inaurata madagascariensis TaxID=2747483 RepID=A0A8X6XT91_9ARAC|nr:hypothetical protein TNIN_227571 [Trichonephila inaurata madagascariensis]
MDSCSRSSSYNGKRPYTGTKNLVHSMHSLYMKRMYGFALQYTMDSYSRSSGCIDMHPYTGIGILVHSRQHTLFECGCLCFNCDSERSM